MAINRKKRKISISKSKLPPEQKIAKTKIEKNSDKSKGQRVDNNYNSSGLRVVSGTKKRRRTINIVSITAIAVVIIAVIIINALSPTGIIESIQNGYSAMGSGSYPVNIYSKNATRFESNGDVLCLTNDSFFEVYNQEGKLIQAASHGMSNPRLEVSEARFLLFDRDRYSVKIFNYANELYSKSFDNIIVSASIGRDGTYAVVTGSNSYLNTVYVFDNDNELIYTWNSANYYIVDVAVSCDGEQIALCLVNGENGAYFSKIYVMEFDSASPKYSYSYNGLVSSIMSVNDDYFTANGVNCAYILKWNSNSSSEIFTTGVVRNYTYSMDGIACSSYGRETNEQINTICVINENGSIKNAFSFNARINDISVYDSKIAILSDDAVYVYSLSGKCLQSIKTEVKPMFVAMTEDFPVVVDSSFMRKVS